MRPEDIRQALGFDDLGLLCADRSDIVSRKDVSLKTKISKNCWLDYPIIASPMDTISDVETCVALNKIGAAGILHRFMSIEQQVEKAREIKERSGKCYVAIGLNDYEERVNKLWVGAKPDLFFLDTANGSSINVEMLMDWWNGQKSIMVYQRGCPEPDIIIGNTQTKSSVMRSFAELNADGVRHGIGIGSMCITSLKTGIHCPAVTSLYYAHKAFKNYCSQKKLDFKKQPTILCDGGIRNPADLVKAIVCGADAVICGSIFAGCKETPGEIVTYREAFEVTEAVSGRSMGKDYLPVKYKKFRGMASKSVVDDYKLGDGTKQNEFVEGEETLVPLKGSVVDVVYEFANGLRSAMSYLNFKEIDDMKGALWDDKCIGIKLTNSAFVEGTPHGKII